MTLHIINNTITTTRLQSAVTQIEGEDEVIILGWPDTNKQEILKKSQTGRGTRFYVLADDSDNAGAMAAFKTIDYNDFVNLTVKYNTSISWY